MQTVALENVSIIHSEHVLFGYAVSLADVVFSIRVSQFLFINVTINIDLYLLYLYLNSIIKY